MQWLDSPAGVLAFTRGERTVVVNISEQDFPLPGEVLIASGALSADGSLPPNTAAWIRA
jgi:alpha-glucosidase